jgi:uroporphyrinogen III methyltransferase/synthase
MEHPGGSPGRVYLVGAGPGDPGLVTVRGAECLRRADLVLYDCLADPNILEYINPSAEVVGLGRGSGQRSIPHEEAIDRMIEAARGGKTVVHLKAGDPQVFGGAAGEIEHLRGAGIPYEIVPGITAALATAGYAEIPITHPDHASAVALVIAHPRDGTDKPPLDYGLLAHFPGTLIVYMGESTARQWSEGLISGGKSPDTPVAIVRRCARNDQQTVRSTLGTLAGVIRANEPVAPAVIVVGEVVTLAPEASWFAARPLHGQRVVVTRPREQAGELRRRLAELGAKVYVQPAIRITDPPDWAPVDAALARLDRFDWLVFSSSNGVRYLLDRLLESGGDLRRLGPVKLAAIGPGTAEELARYRLRANLVPEQYRAEALAEALAGDAAGRSFLLARASRGRDVLAEQLAAAGGTVEQIVVYSSTDVEKPDDELASGRIDWITVTSSAIAGSLARLFGETLRGTKLASISPITSETLRRLGYEPSVEATQYTMEGLVEAIVRFGVAGKAGQDGR